ncbi:MAG TPA: glycosyltransferase family A protein, partial [Thermodesulfovibrionales bacterium]|nr:glycosyltransferase family A protein [Thermodesulfovibrionales bacterium]
MNNTSDKPLVSIIVRTKDRPKLLRRALESIASQTYRPIEVVLVNDGGCDLDLDEIKTILGDVSLNYQRLEKNMGRAHAGNVGIENTKGEYVGFLDDDDELYPEHVETLVSYLEQSDFKVAYTDSLMVYKEYDPLSQEMRIKRKELIYSHDFRYNTFIFENCIPLICLLFDRALLVAIGGFDGSFELYEDHDLLIRLGEKNPFHHIRTVTAEYNQWSDESQISQMNKNSDFLKTAYLSLYGRH